ncbi:MAG: hypothetical protein AAGL97_16590 [Pseudomonadota bacterium]
MFVDWPDHSEWGFGKETLFAKHNISQSNLFTDDGLAHLIDEYPRANLDIWAFTEQREGQGPTLRGRAPKMSGKDIVEAVKNGKIWLNLRRAGEELFDLKHISETIFDSLEDATGRKTMKQDMGLLISSPSVEVNYHLDIPMVALFQLRGQKRLWLYPRDEDLAPSSRIEDIVHMTREEELPYRAAFDELATVHDLTPGMGLTWPQLAPHRVRNADCVNVSLSCEFMTWSALINANAAYTNGLMRRGLNLSPKLSQEPNPASLAKAAFAQMHKTLSGRTPRVSPTPITFELDVTPRGASRNPRA